MELYIGTCLTFLTFLSFTSLSGSSPIKKISINSVKTQSLIKSDPANSAEVKDIVPSEPEYKILKDNKKAPKDENMDQSTKKKRRRRRRKHRSKNSKSRKHSSKRRLSKYKSNRVDYVIVKSKNNTDNAINEQSKDKVPEIDNKKVIIEDLIFQTDTTTSNPSTEKTKTTPNGFDSPKTMAIKDEPVITTSSEMSKTTASITTPIEFEKTYSMTTTASAGKEETDPKLQFVKSTSTTERPIDETVTESSGTTLASEVTYHVTTDSQETMLTRENTDFPTTKSRNSLKPSSFQQESVDIEIKTLNVTNKDIGLSITPEYKSFTSTSDTMSSKVTKSTTSSPSSTSTHAQQTHPVSLPNEKTTVDIKLAKKSIHSLMSSTFPAKEEDIENVMDTDNVGTNTIDKVETSPITLNELVKFTTSEIHSSTGKTDAISDRKTTKSITNPVSFGETSTLDITNGPTERTITDYIENPSPPEPVNPTELTLPLKNIDEKNVEMYLNGFTKTAPIEPESTSSIFLEQTGPDVSTASIFSEQTGPDVPKIYHNQFTTPIETEPEFLTTITFQDESTVPPTTQEINYASVPEITERTVDLPSKTTKQAPSLSYQHNMASRLETKRMRPTGWVTSSDNEDDISDYFTTFSSDENSKHSLNGKSMESDDSNESKFNLAGKRHQQESNTIQSFKSNNLVLDNSEENKEVYPQNKIAITDDGFESSKEQHTPKSFAKNADLTKDDDFEDKEDLNVLQSQEDSQEKIDLLDKQPKSALQNTNADGRQNRQFDHSEIDTKIKSDTEIDTKNSGDKDSFYSDEEYDQLDVETFLSLLNMLNRKQSGEVNSKTLANSPSNAATDNYVYDSGEKFGDTTLKSSSIHKPSKRQILPEKSSKVFTQQSNELGREKEFGDFFDSEYEFYSDSNDEYDFSAKKFSNDFSSSEVSSQISENERNIIKPLSQNPNTGFFSNDKSSDEDQRSELDPRIQEEKLKKQPKTRGQNTNLVQDRNSDSGNDDEIGNYLSAKMSSKNLNTESTSKLMDNEVRKNDENGTPDILSSALNYLSSKNSDDKSEKISSMENQDSDSILQKEEEELNEMNKTNSYNKSPYFSTDNSAESYTDNNLENTDDLTKPESLSKEGKDLTAKLPLFKETIDKQNQDASSDDIPNRNLRSKLYPDSEYEFYSESGVNGISRNKGKFQRDSDSERKRIQGHLINERRGTPFINDNSDSLLDASFEYEFYSDSDDSMIENDRDDKSMSRKDTLNNFMQKPKQSLPSRTLIHESERSESEEGRDFKLPKSNLTERTTADDLQSDDESDILSDEHKTKSKISQLEDDDVSSYEEANKITNTSGTTEHMEQSSSNNDIESRNENTSDDLHQNQNKNQNGKPEIQRKAYVTESDSSSFEYYYESGDDESTQKPTRDTLTSNNQNRNNLKRTVPKTPRRVILYSNSVQDSDGDSWNDSMFETDEYDFKSSGENQVISKKIADTSDDDFGYFSDDNDWFEYSDEYEYEYDTDENEPIRNYKIIDSTFNVEGKKKNIIKSVKSDYVDNKDKTEVKRIKPK